MMRRSLLITIACVCFSAAVSMAQAAAPVSALPTGPGPAADALIKVDTKVGSGKEAMAGANVSVNYTGWLYKPMAKDYHGKHFDSSIGRGPFDFRLGAGMVIKGWDQGVAGMKVGGKRTLIIPSSMAYGSKGAGGMIPADAALIFDVELLEVK